MTLPPRESSNPSPYAPPEFGRGGRPPKPWWRRGSIVGPLIALITGLVTLRIQVTQNAKASPPSITVIINRIVNTGPILAREIREVADSSSVRDHGRAFREVQMQLVSRGLDLQLTATYEYRLEDTTNMSYAAGRYSLADSPAARLAVRYLTKIALPIITRRLGAQTTDTEIIGSADGIPVRKDARYEGDLGAIRRYPYGKGEGLRPATLTIGTGDRLRNESIAFLRAYAVGRALRRAPDLYKGQQRIETRTYADTGGAFRRTSVIITLQGALRPLLDSLPEAIRGVVLDSISERALSRRRRGRR